jgi:diacylglycerol kinase family enzyme
VLAVATSALGGGQRIRRHRRAVWNDDLAEATVTSDRPFPYQVDGEYLGMGEHFELRAVPEAVVLVSP